jgi:hypothetical protein
MKYKIRLYYIKNTIDLISGLTYSGFSIDLFEKRTSNVALIINKIESITKVALVP